jgi:hypothetical protein
VSNWREAERAVLATTLLATGLVATQVSAGTLGGFEVTAG